MKYILSLLLTWLLVSAPALSQGFESTPGPTATANKIVRKTTAQRPQNPVGGDIYFDTTLNTLMYYTGSVWAPAGGGGVAVGDANTWTGSQTFRTARFLDSNQSHYITLAFGDESANRILSVPALNTDSEIVTQHSNQIIPGSKTFVDFKVYDTVDYTETVQITSGNQTANRVLTIPTLTGNARVSVFAQPATHTGAGTAVIGLNIVDGTSAGFSLALPTAVGHAGEELTVKRIDNNPSNVITLDPNSSETIDGAATQDIINQWASWTLVSNGSNWLNK